nr:antiviral reverse transcriptase Drt5 [Endozoicomonas elysicola]
MVEKSASEISDYISKIGNPSEKQHCFLSQETVYASKTKHHLRRTIKLDPVAEYYLYEMAYKNRKIFRKSNNPNRQHFGYRFSEGKKIEIHQSYKEFIDLAERLKCDFKYHIKFDISSYFNSIYHHDLLNWFSAQKTTSADMELLGQFMREINSGFSIDFLPHGLYPTKMLGSHFLSYIDHSELIKCEAMIRFMDDFLLFSDSKDILVKDFETIQKSLGQKSLNINSAKTILFGEEDNSISKVVDEIKERVMGKVNTATGSGIDYEVYIQELKDLNKKEIDHLLSLVSDDNITDDEVSLIIDCICEHTSDFKDYAAEFIYKFPHLSKKIFHKCSSVENYEELSHSLHELVKTAEYLNEYQLFWIAKITEKYLLDTSPCGKIFALLYEHKNATTISKAKILEIPGAKYGMPEWREIHLKNGSSGWLSWASAIGMRNDTKQTKNYLMSYFSKASSINKLIADTVTAS